MKNKQAFTLIELLVIVLIIGILVAVAVPQYQMAVAKSRYVSIWPTVQRIAEAQELYYVANGEYATSIDELDVQWPAGGEKTIGVTGEKFSYSNAGNTIAYRIYVDGRVIGNVSNNLANNNYEVPLIRATSKGSGYKAICETNGPAKLSVKLCESLGAKPIPNWSGYYFLP